MYCSCLRCVPVDLAELLASLPHHRSVDKRHALICVACQHSVVQRRLNVLFESKRKHDKRLHCRDRVAVFACLQVPHKQPCNSSVASCALGAGGNSQVTWDGDFAGEGP